jgi:hypothetical protein
MAARGSNTYIAMFEESTYNTVPSSPYGTIIHTTGTSIKGSQTINTSNTLRSNRTPLRGVRGNLDVTGDISVEVSPENIGWLLRHLMGGYTVTGTGPYVHSLIPGALPVGMLLERDFGSAISGSGRFERFGGCRVSQAKVSIPKEGFVTATFSINGASQTLSATTLDSILNDSNHNPFSASEVTAITEGGSATSVIQSLDLTISNNLDTSQYTLGSGTIRKALDEGMISVSGSLTALFSDTSIFTKMVNGTTSSLSFTLSRGTGLGAAGNESLAITLSNVDYERSSPEISGPAGILLSANFSGYGTNIISMVLKNSVASLIPA